MATMTDADLLALYERTVDELYRYASRLTGGDATLADSSCRAGIATSTS